MGILYRTVSELYIGGKEARFTVYGGTSGSIRAELEPYSANSSVYTDGLDAVLSYNGEEKTLSCSPFTKAVSCLFHFVGDVKSITLSSSDGIVYGGVSYESYTFTWAGDGTINASPVPSVTYYSDFIRGSTSRLEWKTDGIPDGYRAYTIGVWEFRSTKAAVEPVYTRSVASEEKSAEFVYEHTEQSITAGSCIFYRIAFGLFPEDSAEEAGREDYELYFELDSPVYVCSGTSDKVVAPHSLCGGSISKNRVTNVTWSLPYNSSRVAGFCLEYTYDTGTWYTIFWNVCASNSYSFTVPTGATRIAFRIASYSVRGKADTSSYSYSPWLELTGSNVYVGYRGGVVRAAEISVGTSSANAVVSVG